MPSPRHRLVPIIFVIVASVTCLTLGWWQWSRFQAVGGTAQNLGYSLQWPLFAVFFVYTYRRYIRLERARDDESTSSPEQRPLPPITAIPEGLLPVRTPSTTTEPVDPVRAEYNRQLADLYARDEAHHRE